MFVSVVGSLSGIGKLVDRDVGRITVEYFDSPAQPAVSRYRVTVSASEVRPVRLDRQTKVYRCDARTARWDVGRVIQYDGDSNYAVRFPNSDQPVWIGEDELFVRWKRPIADPTNHLALRCNETAFFHPGRSAFVQSCISQRAACAGMSGLLSASIDLEAHQIEVVRRVLQDPVQRYLLADEVGLGKTIEAGVLIRQYVLDSGRSAASRPALVVVPSQLRQQWQAELVSKMHLGPFFHSAVVLVTYEQLVDTLRGLSDGKRLPGMIVVDEAHHLAAFAHSPDGHERATYDAIEKAANAVDRLLLLSAMPILHNEQAFLAMLHLLDPVVYRLDDLSGFRERVAARQQLAEMCQELAPQTASIFLQDTVDGLVGLFPADGRLARLADELKPWLDLGVDESDPNRATALGRLRTHVSETYRLHRRLLRNRQSRLPDLLPGRGGVAARKVAAPLLQDVVRLLDRWREGAALHTREAGDAAVALAAEAFRLGIESACADLHAAACWATLRAGRVSSPEGYFTPSEVATIQAALPFPGEADLLDRLVHRIPARSAEVAEDAHDRHQLEELLLCIGHYDDLPAKVVVFTSFASTADRVHCFLKQDLGDRVVRHRPDGSTDTPDDWHRFHTDAQCKVLVCDRRAEEGLNLHGGDKVLVHYDLPTNPNRVEQRLGRLDRYGAGTKVNSYVFCGQYVEDQQTQPIGYQRRWIECLANGFGVFKRSIASLQYLVDAEMDALWKAVLLEGVTEIKRLTDVLKGDGGRVAKEFKRVRAQDELDALPTVAGPAVVMDADDGTFVSKLVEFDLQHKPMFDAARAWLYTCLRLESFGHSDELVKYEFHYSDGVAETLLPQAEVLGRFRAALDVLPGEPIVGPLRTECMAFRRSVAVRYGSMLARVGHPLFDLMEDYVRWDDRGICFAMWRCVPPAGGGAFGEEPTARPELALRFDFVIEAGLPGDLSSGIGRDALHRLAAELFPPILHTVWLDADLRPIEDAARLDVLTPPYSKKRPSTGGTRDYNLNASRWPIADAEYGASGQPLSADDWHDLCTSARVAAEARLKDVVHLSKQIDCRAANALHRTADVISQLESRIEQLGPGPARNAEQAQIDMLQEQGKRLRQAIKTPTIRLDAIGAVFTSDHDPFANHPDEAEAGRPKWDGWARSRRPDLAGPGVRP